MTLTIITFSIMTHSIKILSKMSQSIMTLISVHIIMTLGMKTLSKMTPSIVTRLRI
jgi:hypothetical protein